MSDPNAHIDLQWDMLGDARNAIVEEVSESESSVDSLAWVPESGLDLLDLSTPVATSTWDDGTITCEAFDSDIGLSFD